MTRLRTLLPAFLLFSTCITPPAHASERAAVRPTSGDVARVLAHATSASPTVRHLIDQLADSNVIVHLVETAMLDPGIAGSTQFVTAAGGFRYLRIWLDVMLHPNDAAAMLAHELQHALEVARAPQVMDERGFERLYLQIGDACGGNGSSRRYDTGAARAVGALAAREIRTSGRAAARRP